MPEPTRGERIKNHLKEHKEAYIVGAIGLAGITCALMRDVVHQPISSSIAGTARRSIVVTGKKIMMNNVSYINSNRQGPPSWVVRCIETGALFTSQRAAAIEMGLRETDISRHLNGARDHVHGNHFERICLAA